MSGRPAWLVPVAAVVGIVVLAGLLVALTLQRPELPVYPPTVPAPRDAGNVLTGPVQYTVDATNSERWRYFSFRLGSVIDDADPTQWDLAFRRFQIIANGGRGFRGRGGVLDLGPVAFAAVRGVATTGYQENEGSPDPTNRAIAGWYRYGFFSHALLPKPHVWAVRTADGRYAKIEILSYYCPGPQPGCLTFRYVYQGDGSAIVGRMRLDLLDSSA
jgi:heme-binding HmuY-like protein